MGNSPPTNLTSVILHALILHHTNLAHLTRIGVCNAGQKPANMKCLICNDKMENYFSKEFNAYNLTTCNYYKCGTCGFVASKTHYDLSPQEWEQLNYEYHTENNNRVDNPNNRNQRYFNQALMISILKKHDLLGGGNFLDWASGIGAVSILSKILFDVEISNYDKYIEPHFNTVGEDYLKERSFDLVINCALFEHVSKRETLDEIEALVAHDGAFAIHTLVPEVVPKDPEWMYLLPVHCSFHTNASMQLLMDQWGYKCSVYNEHSKLWVLFKRGIEEIKPQIDKINKLLGWEYLKFKNGFVDYWK